MGGIATALEVAGTAVADSAATAAGAVGDFAGDALKTAANGGKAAGQTAAQTAAQSPSILSQAYDVGSDALSGFANGLTGQKDYFINSDGSTNWTKALTGAAGAYAGQRIARRAHGAISPDKDYERARQLIQGGM